MPRSSSLKRTRPRPNCQSQESPVGAAPVLLCPLSQPLTTAVSTQVVFIHSNWLLPVCFSRATSIFYIIHQASLIYSSLLCFLPSVLLLSPELSCGLADSSSHLKTLAPHLYSPSPLSSRAGSEPPPSSPPSALPAPAPVTSSLSPPPPPPPPSSHVSSQDATLPVESEEEKAKKLLYCSLCKVAVNSLSQLEAHNAGKEVLFSVYLISNPSWQQQRPKIEKCTVKLLCRWHLLIILSLFYLLSCGWKVSEK